MNIVDRQIITTAKTANARHAGWAAFYLSKQRRYPKNRPHAGTFSTGIRFSVRKYSAA